MSILPNYLKPSKTSVRLVFCESFDQRIIRVAGTLSRHKLARVVMLGNRDNLGLTAERYDLDLKNIEVVDYESKSIQDNFYKTKSGLVKNDAAGRLDTTDPVVMGAWLVKNGMADAIIAGAAATPSQVMRVFLRVLGVADECRTMSGMSLVVLEGCEFVRNQVVGMADVGVVPDPTVGQLADIAIQSAASYELLTGNRPKIGFLSFATATDGGENFPTIKKIKDAVELVRARKPDLMVDGEMQLDAALIPSAAGIKSPSSTVAGSANVLIFPSLDAGNIAVKIFQKFSQYHVFGPILQGTKFPCTYIPRASSAEDILDQVGMLLSLST
jgi:phosphate acetyltransferase